MSPAVGFHLGLEGDAIKLITVEGELRYLLLVESPLSAPLRALVVQAALSDKDARVARVRAEVQADGQTTLWLKMQNEERGAFSGALGSDKISALDVSPAHKGHRF